MAQCAIKPVAPIYMKLLNQLRSGPAVFFFCLMGILISCKEQKGGSEQAQRSGNDINKAESINDESWYKMLQGNIGAYPITMHLHKLGHVYAGYYYYNREQQPIYFNGDDTTRSGSFSLMAYTPAADSSELFVFTINKNGATGAWHRTEAAKPLSFTATEVSSSLSFAYLFTEGEYKPFQNEEDMPLARFEAGSIWPNGNMPAAETLRKEIIGLFTEKPTSQPLDAILAQTKDSFFTAYKQELAGVKAEDAKEMPSMYAQESSQRVMVVYQDERFISIASFVYTYTGGAHGNYGTGYFTIDLAAQKKIELNDILTPAGKAALPGLLEKAFRLQYKVEPGTELSESGLFENKIEPTDNFFVTGNGIGFNYVPYEIGPYAMGEVLLFVSFEDLFELLTPAFRAKLKKN